MGASLSCKFKSVNGKAVRLSGQLLFKHLRISSKRNASICWFWAVVSPVNMNKIAVNSIKPEVNMKCERVNMT